MQLYPAIDLKGGKVVRLSQGDAARATVYAADPVAQADAFLEAGARWLHVIDLDRAFGTGDNIAAVAAIARRAEGRARVQCGGGLRSEESIEAALGAGVRRVVIGTAAVSEPALVVAAVAAHGPARVTVGIDARKGWVALRGWTEQSALAMEDVARRVLGEGIRSLIYTDIERDGMLSGPDLEGCRALGALGASVIASGGFATLDDVRAARDAGCAGAILGRSLYEGKIDLSLALAVAAGRKMEE